LPTLSFEGYTEHVKNGRCLLVIDGIVHDVEDFVGHNPGEKYLLEHIGKDATKLFHGGGIHAHSHAAENLLSTTRFARIEDHGPQS
jgi:stearoyl-CoA desaturase (delta-9 desaturase)